MFNVPNNYKRVISGGADFQTFHHKGKQKKLTSLSMREGRLFESLIRLSVQIVWIALGRKWFTLIGSYINILFYNHFNKNWYLWFLGIFLRKFPFSEIEVNRLFRSNKFNLAEHHAKIDTAAKMSLRDRQVFLGKCLQPSHKLKSHSPLLSEFHCDRKMDFRLLGLGVVKYPE